MGAIVSDYSEIGKWAVVGEGAVVKNKEKIPDGSIVVGVPAKIIAEVTSDYKKQWTEFKKIYSDLAQNRFPKSLKELKRSEL